MFPPGMLDEEVSPGPTAESVQVGDLVHVDRIGREHLYKQQDQLGVSRGRNKSAVVQLSLVLSTKEVQISYHDYAVVVHIFKHLVHY